MKKITVVIAILIISVLMISCNNFSGDLQQENNLKYEKIVYAFPIYNNAPSSDSIKTVEEEINKITRKKIGIEVQLKPISIYKYSNDINIALQNGEKIDCFQAIGEYNDYLSSGMAYDITDMLDTCAPGIKNVIEESFLNMCMKDGRLYGVPTYKPYALTPMVVYRKDIADELGIDMNSIKTINDLTTVLTKVKKSYPDIIPLVPKEGGNSGISLCSDKIDYLTDDYNSPKGVLVGDNMTVVDYYSTDDFYDKCKLIRSWYNDELIMKDASTTTSSPTELISNGRGFCFVASYSYPSSESSSLIKLQCNNVDIGAVQIGESYLDTSSVNVLTWMISSQSKNPKSALKFLDLTFSDREIINLIIYGINGRDYCIDENGFVNYPEGNDALQVPYTAQLSSGLIGNYFLINPMKGTNPESIVWEENQNYEAERSKAMGFTFNNDNLKTEYILVRNVINQYLPALLCGSVDPDVILPEFKDKLNKAGLDKIIQEKQKQLNEWLK